MSRHPLNDVLQLLNSERPISDMDPAWQFGHRGTQVSYLVYAIWLADLGDRSTVVNVNGPRPNPSIPQFEIKTTDDASRRVVIDALLPCRPITFADVNSNRFDSSLEVRRTVVDFLWA